MQMSWEESRKLSEGGNNSFFKLEDGQSARVRFIYNNYGEIIPLGVHSIQVGNQYPLIDCCREIGQPKEVCKWCNSNHAVVTRVVLPLYNLETNNIEYWTRSGKWVDDNLFPLFEEIPSNQTIAGQTYKIKRKGTGRDTNYTVMIEPSSQNDGRTKESFGELKTPFEIGAIKPNDYELPADTQTNTQAGTFGSQQNNNNNNFTGTSTRRTTDMF